MNLSLTNKTSFFILFVVTILLAPLTASSATKGATDWLDEPVNIRFQDKPLSNVLKQISQQTGISIAYDQKLANEKISGNYQDVKASDAITRLFKSKNKSIQVNKENKVIIVKTFGAKSFIWAGTIQGQNNSSQITLAELEKMHTQQYKRYKQYIANDNEILDAGMTRGEIHALHQKQSEEYKATLDNDNEILDAGMTRGEIRALHQKQSEEYKATLDNDNEILDAGMTRGEIRALHQKQNNAYFENISNKSASKN